MRKKLLLAVFLGGSLIAAAGDAFAQKKPEYIYPKATFDEAATDKQMDPGTSVVRGSAVVTKKGKLSMAEAGSSILLFPSNAYYDEFFALRKKYPEGGKKEASMENAAFSYRIQGKFLDNIGTFEFKNLKPGKYYIMTWIPYEKKKRVRLETGKQWSINFYTGVIGSEPVYGNFIYRYKEDMVVGGFVEVQKDGEVVEAIISNLD
ncbi:hypothetical protein [Chitinophaga solisilvae]|uniref:Uncharacterized protein n=1 Tax=Chitinophaga solisilvae TaxID=1233460 RepID=A0A3S1DJQ7_9BACT|nr:hypothetical protein [Chitinophaga solisilvae]NSL88364.1 hypothetical protein [Chitinophaga solisilvae]